MFGKSDEGSHMPRGGAGTEATLARVFERVMVSTAETVLTLGRTGF